MYKTKRILITFLSLCSLSLNAQQYVMPPTSSTSGYVPVISDELMKQCVEIYNKADWLDKALNKTYLNQYSSYDIAEYNRKVNQVNQWTNWFNQHCAGKQSHSACQAAQELNRKAGNPTQSCR
ncbi:stress protein, tellurium resistance protein TerZ [Rodentibacter pneumotropicus]|uniref:Stress protein, tellurium resistance protein TerZ n=2 Tax=Rodentibacter pneumotropicus TaxID=758 RepID=A0A1V3K478_9PAST|nr:stress protein, tellurium resistance protein TerZ [Rodentibacter pneumotropicus]MCQ9122049.1 stress protein, tellurium resistance protein TerZ [Rodentibacter pneumotropicus]OOF67942.1 stress protein, tellurium resistance protein TerZ [Rodentibacter pneumotropicus]THA11436.1 stress protein, tellurium resistance protein TerZ [Rodentibacter pneumotropicus]